jgi:hypothetical protein
MRWLTDLADVASIITAAIAAWAYGFYRLTLYHRTKALEKILAEKDRPNDDSLTLKQLAIALKLTEDQVIEAASRSKKIESWAGQTGTECRFRIGKSLGQSL